ncbi:CYP-33A1 protein [Aphelenchoides avenae]|nr:CYP-33A1 protein [Aphelenchus avenae]
MCADLFAAGQETTSSTLKWAVAYLINSPEKQAKLRAELDDVIGSDRLITMSDMPSLPYTNAVIAEAQRLCNLLPQNLLHRTTRETQLDGFALPVNTVIVPQISCVLYDDKVFHEPREFVPERFINDNGSFKKPQELIPFGLGKRQCLGENLARMELFLFLSNLFNQFKLSRASTPPSLRRTPGFGAACLPYLCTVEKRHT